MCGIAGFSLAPDSPIDAIAAARVLIASVAERGADAAGCAWSASGDGTVTVHKQPGGASDFLDSLDLPAGQRQVLLHVRDHTKGRPSLPANNHPIRHGTVVGVHNGTIANDEAVFAELGVARAEPGMTVDSEAIFALLHWVGDAPRALERLRGALACAWFDERRPGSVFLARGFGRPLWTATARNGRDSFWASTLEALEIAEEFLALRLHKRPVAPGSVLELADGRVVAHEQFVPDAQARWLVNPVASPEERDACLVRLRAQLA